MLRSDAKTLARQLLPKGALIAGEWRCNGTNSPTGSAISVCITGPKQGVCGFWNGEDRGGDILDLIEIVNGVNKRGAVAWAKDWLGLADDAPATRANLAAKRKKPVAARQKHQLDAAESNRNNRKYASRTWRDASPLSGAGAAYLRHRGLDPTFAEDLRFTSALRHPEGGSFPALIGRVESALGVGIGIWRIYVKMDGCGKAPVEAPKLGLGHALGGAVRLGGIASEIAVVEGIETAIAVRQLIAILAGKKIPVWAALSTAGMRSLVVPPQVNLVHIYADADAERFRNGKLCPSPGLDAAEELRQRLLLAGQGAAIESPPAGMDWLDVFNVHRQMRFVAA